MGSFQRIERLVRSKILGYPFVLTNLLTDYEVIGRKNLDEALERREREECGLISISNHLSLFDDPLVFAKLLGLTNLTVETKCWWSTPCESNFKPHGKGLGSKFVRYFSDVSNMVFFARPAKKEHSIVLPDSYAETMAHRGGKELMSALEAKVSRERWRDVESLLRQYISPGEPSTMGPLNQEGMVEACARVGLGDWLHFFPEGGRSRDLHLRPPRRGVGKVIYHNPDALLLPVCFYGTQDVMPIKSKFPRPFKRIVVHIGKPVRTGLFYPGQQITQSPQLFQTIAEASWEFVKALRPETLVRYLGKEPALALLRSELPEPEHAPLEERPIPERAPMDSASSYQPGL